MSPRRLLAVCFAATSIAAAVVAVSCTTSQQASNTAAPAESPVERGNYLVTIMGCNDCHTPGYFYGSPDTTRRLSGSEVGWNGPWGVVFPANLTPDPETGLGNWTDEQIETALRTGARPDGRLLAPIMPWTNFAHLNHEDAAAIIAYLRSLPPVVHAEPAPVPPTGRHTGSMFVVPPPAAWDAQNLPPPSDAPGQ